MTARILEAVHADRYGNLFRDHTLERLWKVASPRYLGDKLALLAHERRHPEQPWLTRDAVDLLDRHLAPDHHGFEWGSGNGTLWFAQRCASLVCVEHNPRWAEIVRAQLVTSGARNVDHRLVAEADYVRAIDAFPDERFDFVVVDGLFRDEAFLRSIPKVKPGGWIVFDNANWYLPSESRTPHSRSHAEGPASVLFGSVAERVRGWKTMWTTNGVDDTVILVKPGGPSRAEPDVSVIIPTFHRERELMEAVRSALDQQGVSVEVVVVDDSEEGLARSAVLGIGDPRVRYWKRPVPSRGNPCLVRNDGIALARGRYLHFLDDDDRLDAGALDALSGALDRSPRAGAAFGTVLPFGPDTPALAHERAYFARARERLRACRSRRSAVACLLFKEAPIINSASMIRSEVARAIGGYEPRVSHCEDADMYLRAVRASGFVFVDRPVVHYRTDGASRIHRPDAERAVAEAYGTIHRRYRAAHGWIELWALKLLARALL